MRASSIYLVVAIGLTPAAAFAQGAPPTAAPAPPPPAPGGYPPPPAGYAAPPPGYPPPPPGYYPPPGGYYPPPPAYVPPVDPTIRNHDGFYLRMGLGGGYLSDSETVSAGSQSLDYKISGGGVIGEFMLGGTPGRGIVVGGGLQFGSFPSPTVKTPDGNTATGTNASLNLTTLGPFIDYYFDPSQGLHLQALIGFGTLSVSNNNGNSTRSGASPSGLALSVGFGDEWWVGEQWSIGVLARLQYLNAKHSESILGFTATDANSVVVPGLLVTFTNH